MKTTKKVYVINAANVDALADKYERYTLAAQPAALPKRATFQSTKTRQTVLLTGLDCLATMAAIAKLAELGYGDCHDEPKWQEEHATTATE